MADDKSKTGTQDRTKVAGEEDYEVRCFAQQHNLSSDQVRDLNSKYGNDCATLEREGEGGRRVSIVR